MNSGGMSSAVAAPVRVVAGFAALGAVWRILLVSAVVGMLVLIVVGIWWWHVGRPANMLIPLADAMPSEHTAPASSILGAPTAAAVNSASDGMHDVLKKSPAAISLERRDGEKEVFNIDTNKFSYDQARAVCSAFGAELATEDQLIDAARKGASWCNYGWSAGQKMLYPTSKEVWDKLQAGPPENRNDCQMVGVNGGFMDDPSLELGVNCWGVRPLAREIDLQKLANAKYGVPSADSLEFDKQVAALRAKAASIGIAPWQPGVWGAPGV